MKQFAFGSDAKFDVMWNNLTGEKAKRIKFDVTLPNNIAAKLVFESGRNTVKVSLQATTTATQAYNGSSAFIRQLLEGNQIEFRDCKSLKEYFHEMQQDFAVKEEKTMPIEEPIHINSEDLSAELKIAIIGQDAQIDSIAMRTSNHLSKPKPKKPLTIMLAGPTGVGKTATARELAKILGVPLIMIKCNELKEEFRISQLIGSPAGYVGYGDPCVMEPIKHTNRAVIVFDEFEKAHPSIHLSVMDWMDTGKVTFAHMSEGEISNEYDCAASIIIMTSNIPMNESSGSFLRFKIDQNEEAHISSIHNDDEFCRRIMVNNGFKPEIAGRIAYYYVYNNLTMEDRKKILVRCFKNKALEYGVEVVGIDDALVDNLHSRYSFSNFGVRNIENALDSLIGELMPKSFIGSNKRVNVSGSHQLLIFKEDET